MAYLACLCFLHWKQCNAEAYRPDIFKAGVTPLGEASRAQSTWLDGYVSALTGGTLTGGTYLDPPLTVLCWRIL